MNSRFAATLATLAGLCVMAWFTLDGKIRWATLIFLGGIALKTCLVVLKRRED